MGFGVAVMALVVLALITQAGVLALQRAYPREGRSVEVKGASLTVLDIGPRDMSTPPIVMIHGASSNLGTDAFAARRHAGQNPSGDPNRSPRPWLEPAPTSRGFPRLRSRCG